MTAKGTKERELISGMDDLLGGKKYPPAMKFEALHVPQKIVVSEVSRMHDRTFDPNGGLGELRYWPDGSKLEIPVVIGTVNGEERALFVKGKLMATAFRDANREAGGLAIGDTITVEWSGEQEVLNKKGQVQLDPRTKEPMLAREWTFIVE